MINDVLGIVLKPKTYLQGLESKSHGPFWGVIYTAVLSLFPPMAFYWGTTVQGWEVGSRTIKIEAGNAFWLAVFFYLALITGTICTGVLVSWISRTYTEKIATAKGVETIALCATPMFLSGLGAIYPVLWFDILLATTAAAYAIYLIYLSLNVHLKISEEKSFLYTCATLAFISVAAICVMGATAIAWEFMATPTFIG